MEKRRVVLFGPGPVFKGGISNYNTSLAKALDKAGAEVTIVSWTQQYPAIIPRDFIDRKSKKDVLEGTNIKVEYITNYNNPATWNQTYKLIKKLNPEMVVFQWAIAIQGLPMGYIARKLSKNTKIEVVFDCHLIVQKEASSIDKFFTKYGLRVAHSYITHARKTAEELIETFPKLKFEDDVDGKRAQAPARTIINLYHPVYDMFKINPDFDVEAQKKELNQRQHVFLFFGFIRKYKGLHWVLPAFAKVAAQRDDVSLLVVGESFWNTLDQSKLSTRIKKATFGALKSILLPASSDEGDYNPLAMIPELGIEDRITVINEFVPNEDVHKYFQVSDAILTYYETATPSGVESIAYNFNMPVLATRVGHFPETIQDGFNGYLAEPGDIDSMAEQMLRFIDAPIPRENVAKTASRLSWENYAKALLNR